MLAVHGTPGANLPASAASTSANVNRVPGLAAVTSPSRCFLAMPNARYYYYYYSQYFIGPFPIFYGVLIIQEYTCTWGFGIETSS